VTDSQLPRFEVFVQEREGAPHLHAGSVHAADPELALLNARDVFSRRPECRSLWVIPAERVFRRTAEQMATEGTRAKAPAASAKEAFLLFGKLGHKGTHTYLATVEAADSSEALSAGLASFNRQDVTSWWVAAERDRQTSSPDEAGAWFDPALDKPFRDQAFYPVETFMRNLGRGRRQKAR
jgi:ring-1,2-phenylacetyl-CoA epoxidase subunit PaaB